MSSHPFQSESARCCLGLLFLALGPLVRPATLVAQDQASLTPGNHTTLDAHNCYPYEGRWSDRIDRALSHGFPVAIEQDLFWYTDSQTGKSRSVLAHTNVFHGDEPSLETYFFERIRPLIEAELDHPQSAKWPLITLNLADQKEHVVFLLWGNYARAKKSLIDTERHLILGAPHPSPFSAYTGFFGSKHFSQTNAYLEQHKMEPIDW